MNVGIIGAGKLGLSMALVIERAGFNVIVSDINQSYVDSLNDKKFYSNEPFVNQYLIESKKLSATSDNKELIDKSDIIFIIVSTPSLDNGKYDVTSIFNIFSEFKKVNLFNKIIVITSTVNPGDCEIFNNILKDTGASLLYNPEFIAQGSIIQDLKKADLVLIGGEDIDSINKLIKVYKSFQEVNSEVKTMSFRSAEITKIAINSFLTLKISFANLVGQYLIKNKLFSEIDIVLSTIGTDRRIGNDFLNYGFGFGGPCLPRDNRAFGNALMDSGNSFNFGKMIDDFNLDHLEFLKQYYIEQNIKRLPFYFEYVSYKKGIDIFEESHQLKLCEKFLKENYTVYVKDTVYLTPDIKLYLSKYNNLKFINNLIEPVFNIT
jgi:nucleotide sugar dehydrogenase